MAHLSWTGEARLHYGCVNVGFVVKDGGSYTGSPRLLAYGFDKDVSVGEDLANEFAESVPAFVAIAVPKVDGDIYTSASFPVRSEEFEKGLSADESEKLDAALKKACLIDDLYGRLTDGNKKPTKLSPLPTISQLIGESDAE